MNKKIDKFLEASLGYAILLLMISVAALSVYVFYKLF